ncbi:hypothetical protein A9P82_08315 [Arachidicoccus ginsenosidimutans]|uniref:DUF6934 family protein n=1 Tax=Arachidicoccus sp. BS20 TaxID=1850526 RepID=UPI0007F1816B|nr:hypothetical protein [Arachidicoccus sp. BS20]ANI89293.1 hypothetical protein A9P82_08315 [Arachidicoccus sp. BS20]
MLDALISKGKKHIGKIVEFTPTSVAGLYNLGFGDLLPDGSVDDSVNSNNGDIIKVLATVVHILKEFTRLRPYGKVVFTGSTPERLVLYRRILKTYYVEFSEEFIITGFILEKGHYKEVIFEPKSETEYLAFFIRRIV